MNPVTSLTASASAAVLLGKLGTNLKRPQTPAVDKSNPFIGYFNKSSSTAAPQRILPRPKVPTKQYTAHGRFNEYLTSTSKLTCDTPRKLHDTEQMAFGRRNSNAERDELAKSPLTTLPFFPSRFEQEFKQLRVLGKGGQGSVSEVECKYDHKKYAIKKVRVQGKEGRERSRLLTQSLREVHLMANLPRHPNIVRYYTSWLEEEHVATVAKSDDDGDDESVASEEFISYDASSSCGFEFESADEIASESSITSVSPRANAMEPTGVDTTPSINLFIQMELCKQTDSISNLASWLRSTGEDRVKTRGGHAMAMQLFTDVVRGVKHIHSFGVIHRDIKPDNIFLQNGVAKIGDFGLSKHMHETEDGPFEFSPSPSPTAPSSSPDAANHTTALGTFLYASPEQVGRGESSLPKASFYSEKSDIFALGVMLLELCSSFSTIMERVQVLTAVRHGVVPAQAQLAFPAEMSLVTKMTALDPKDRPSADDIFQLLSPTWGGVLHSLHDKSWSRHRKMQLDQF